MAIFVAHIVRHEDEKVNISLLCISKYTIARSAFTNKAYLKNVLTKPLVYLCPKARHSFNFCTSPTSVRCISPNFNVIVLMLEVIEYITEY